MKKAFIITAVFLVGFFCSLDAESQIIRKAGEYLMGASSTVHPDYSEGDSAAISTEDRVRADSLRLQELSLQLEQMKLNEILLRAKLDENNQLHVADSLKRASRLPANPLRKYM